ncbi:MAG: metallo-beta-lactamase family protein [Acidobacteriota bacterium]
MKIRFLGAAGDVTGSAYQVIAKDASILVDCGFFQGRKEESAKNRRKAQIEGGSLDAVVLTHGHLDHVGRLPLLTRNGYKGPIYATRPTLDLATLILKDSQEGVVFSGDLGPRGAPLLKDPEPFKEADAVIMESTYGDRMHRSLHDTAIEGREIIEKAIQEKAKVLVPIFAIGRTQLLLYLLGHGFRFISTARWRSRPPASIVETMSSSMPKRYRWSSLAN